MGEDRKASGFGGAQTNGRSGPCFSSVIGELPPFQTFLNRTDPGITGGFLKDHAAQLQDALLRSVRQRRKGAGNFS